MKIKSFIFNWGDHRPNAKNLEAQFHKVSDVTVISSTDNGHYDHNWVEIGEDKYFVGQLNKALEMFDPNEYDFFLHAQADAYTDQVDEIVKRAIELYEETNWGIYAPNVDFSAWGDIHILEKNYNGIDNIHKMGGCDSTFWMIHKDVIVRLPDHYNEEKNQYGHGIDTLYYKMSTSVLKRPILRDYNFTVDHEKHTGYPGIEAMEQGERNKESYQIFLTDCVKW
jgi:hypothetical protein